MNDTSGTRFVALGKCACPFQPPQPDLVVIHVCARLGLALFVCSDGIVRVHDSHHEGLQAYLQMSPAMLLNAFPSPVLRVALSEHFALFQSVDGCAFKVSMQFGSRFPQNHTKVYLLFSVKWVT
jgi:hypothetical protein